MSTVMPRGLTRLLLAVLLLAGCATLTASVPVTIYKGGDGKGNYLAGGMILRHQDASVTCHGETVYACMFTNKFVPWGDRTIHQWFLVVDGGHATRFTACDLEMIVHEASHYIASAEGIVPDPTHNEDGGTLACVP